MLAGTALVLSLLFAEKPSPDVPPVEREPGWKPVAPAAAPEPPPAAPSPAAPPQRVTARSGARQPLPRPAAPLTPPGAAEPEDAAGDSGSLPAGGRAAAGVAFSRESIQHAMRWAGADIEECVDAWLGVLELDEALEGRLVVDVLLGPEGVIEASLVDVEGVPEPMLGCFGGVIYEIEWPLPEDEIRITYPFTLLEE